MKFHDMPHEAIRNPYTLPQPAGPCALQEFLLADLDRGRVLFLRWVKEEEVPLDSMTFEVTMLDALGGELGRVTVTHRGKDIPPVAKEGVFTPERGIPVENGCVDIRIRLLEVTSDAYIYREKNGLMVTEYRPPLPWKYLPRRDLERELARKQDLRVRSRRAGKVRFSWLVPLLAILTLLYLLVFRFYLF